ncbi:MAG: hypothetical protein ACLR78_04920 [Roseburia sp.]
MQYLKGAGNGADGTNAGEILQRMKNRSMSGSENLETPENLKDSDVCPICNGTEWILTEKDGITTAVECKCRERAAMSRRLRFADIPEAFRGMDLKTFRTDVYRQPDSKDGGRCLPDHKGLPG